MKLKKFKRLSPIATTLCIGGALVGSVALGVAEDTDKVKELSDKVDSLEALLKKEGITTDSSKKHVSAMSDITISGFVTASYFYDTSTPSDSSPNAYLWNRNSGSFSINKVKLVLASAPVKTDEWDAGFRASFIWGEDAPIVNTGNYTTSVTNSSGSLSTVKSSASTGFETLREAYVEVNVPIGTGLDIRAGQLISLLNWESGDGGSANPNFSQGNQWFYTGNGPSAGIQFGYNFSDSVSLKVRAQNGMYAGPLDGNNGKTVMAALGIKPCANTWLSLIGFGGAESSSLDVSGASILAGSQFGKLGTGFEFDYFNFSPHEGGESDDLWSVGTWVWYDVSSKFGFAFRADYLEDGNGFGTGGLLGFPGNGGTSLYSLTFTLNIKPVANVKIQPEIRYDGSCEDGGFDGEDSRVIIGCGISYLF